MKQDPSCISFGRFTLDVQGAELRTASGPIPLRPKCFDLLVYFVSNRGRLITKKELLDSVWAGVVVNEATLSRTVTALRAALGDDANSPQYIDTVSRRGYKFIADVSSASKEPVADFTLVHHDFEYPLHAGEQLIGRGYNVTIPLNGSAASRHHARVVVSDNKVIVEDLGSRNGTYVNGTRATGAVEVRPGDEIRIGGDCLILRSRTSETASLPSSPRRSGQ